MTSVRLLGWSVLFLPGSMASAEFSDPDVLRLPAPPEARSDWRPSGELAQLMDAMDDAVERSARVFEPMSATQLNWAPPNGTHTPRWNAEHLVGRQLLFFSQIYAAIDPATHRMINENPSQMPPDYRARHPEWDGEAEADRMRQVARYVRDFGYVLERLPLDQQAPGSQWTPRGLLRQMERHFDEHTANVRQKLELAGWPSE